MLQLLQRVRYWLAGAAQKELGRPFSLNREQRHEQPIECIDILYRGYSSVFGDSHIWRAPKRKSNSDYFSRVRAVGWLVGIGASLLRFKIGRENPWRLREGAPAVSRSAHFEG